MLKKLAACLLAALLLLLLLGSFGHALQHGHAHTEDHQHCPVCLVLCVWEKLLSRLLALFGLLLFAFSPFLLHQAVLGTISGMPRCSLSPVGLKVKITS